jgi:hypothetical protein
MLKVKSYSVMLSILSLLILGESQNLRAQSTAANVSPVTRAANASTSISMVDNSAVTTAESETQELRRQISALQRRLDKLEAQQQISQAATSNVSPTLTGVNTNGQEPSTQQNPAKPTQAEIMAKDKGMLDFFRTVEISGFVDGYYGYNFNKSFNRRNQLRNFDFKNNEFGLNLAELVVERKPAEDSRFGFRLDLDFGPATDWVHSVEPGGGEVYKNVQQAYGSFLAPVGKGLQIDVGKFVTWNGAEVIETKDNWNYTRGLLFAWAIPYYHAGVRATYTVNDKVTLMGALVNGWNNVEDNNGGKTAGLSLTMKPTPKLTIIQNYTGGPEQDDSVPLLPGITGKHFFRHLSDTIVTYNINTKVFLMGNYDYAIERQRTTGGKVHWQGLAAYLHYMPSDKWAFTPRFEWFQDHDGFATCSEDPLVRCAAGKTFKEITVTGEYKFAKNVLGRLEFRNDSANTPFFRKSTQLPLLNPESVLSKNQTTITAGVVFTFSTREQ